MKISLKILIIFLFLSLLIIRPTASYAWHDRWHGRGYVDVNLGVWPGPYYSYPYYPYYADPYYPRYVVASPSTSYQPVVVNGVTYYVNNGAYYIYTQYGYQAVAVPVGVSQPVITQSAVTVSAPATVDTADSFTVNIPNDKGGYSAVVLKQSGKGFVGPQGEFYSEFPKISQLKVMYGK